MGFYGNITNTSRTQFQFDKTYPSRYKMDVQCAKDGVYIGRYVLVEYDSNPNNVVKDGFRKGKLYDFKDGDPLYISSDLDEAKKITYYLNDYWDYDWHSTEVINGVVEGTLVRVKETTDQYVNSNEQSVDVEAGDYSFFICIGSFNESYEYVDAHGDLKTGIRQIAKFKRAVNAMDNYVVNYEEDRRAYPNESGRGWDSTVWQKVYDNGKEKYVMIAELNAVVPTFDIQADAPSMSPLTPHFDEGSTNVYYKLHWQPQWGVRTRAADGSLKTYQLDKNGKIITSKDKLYASSNIDLARGPAETYPSDAATKWEKYEYDSVEGSQVKYQYNKVDQQWEIPLEGLENDEKYQIPAAIYFNKRGFKDDEIFHTNSSNDKIKNDEWDGLTDFISLKPTGWSGHQYSAHDGFKELKPSADTQELMVMLPSIGNTISEVWDLVYGGLDTNEAIKTSHQRNKNIDWENPTNQLHRKGLRLINDRYTPITIGEMINGFEPNLYYWWNEKIGDYELATEEIDGITTYYTRSGGHTFDKAEVNTIAGCINSVHDLMGMIIVDKEKSDNPNTANFSSISSDHIYYYPLDSTYRVKDFEYIYTPLSEDQFKYESITVTPEDFSTYMLYIKDGGVFKELKATDTYSATENYFVKKLIANNSSMFEEIDLGDFSQGFYQTSTGSYIWKTDGTPDDGIIYYDIDHQKIIGDSQVWPKVFSYNFEKNKFYYKHINQAGREVYSLIDVNICDRDKRPFYPIPQEHHEDNHPFLIPINYPDAYNHNLEFRPEDPDIAATWNGPYYSTEGYWDDANGWIEAGYVYPTYFFTQGTYWQKFVQDEGASNPDIDGEGGEQESVENVIYKQLITVPADGFGYILDRPRTNTNMPDEEPQYGDALKAYRVKLINYDSLDPEVKAHLYSAETSIYEEEEENDNGEMITVQKTRYHNFTPVTKEDIDEWFYHVGYRQGGKNSVEPDLLKPKKQIFYISPGAGVDYLYEANRYYYIGTDAKSYIKDTRAEFTPGTQYYDASYFKINKTDEQISNHTYAITPQGDMGHYYRPNKYYYFDNKRNQYLLDTSEKPKPNTTYYIRNDIYIAEDKSNTFTKGAVWNLNALTIPNTVTLSKRETKPVMKQLQSFGRNYNTINGLILELNHLIAADNIGTRDRNTLQGAINYLNDIIVRFDKLTPGDFPIVDYFGRLHGGIAVTDNWIDIKFDPSVVQPKMIVTHEYNPTTLQATSRNMNQQQTGDVGGDSQTIIVPTYTFDSKGHMVASSTHTTTLPYGFKTINAVNNTNISTAPPSSVSGNPIIANNTQDTLNLEMSNKWLLADEATTKTIKIGHVLSGVTANSYGLAQNETLGADGTLKANKTIEVPYFTVDAAGHVTAASTKTVELPAVFNTISVGAAVPDTKTNEYGHDSGSTSATVIEDTFTFNAGNKWINIAINKPSTKGLAISHMLSTLAEGNLGDNTDRTPAFGESFNTLYLTTDAAGHLTASTTKKVTLPGLSLSNDTTTGHNVVTSITYTYSTTNKKGEFKETRAALGSIALNSYTAVTVGNTTNNIAQTDSLSTALNKLETKICTLNGDATLTGSIAASIAAAKNELKGSCTDSFNTLGKIQSWISDGTEGEKSLITRVKANEDAIILLNNNSTTIGSVDYKVDQAVKNLRNNCSTEFDTLAKIESWISDGSEGEVSLVGRVTTLENKALPAYDDLEDGEVYLMKMVGGKPTWIHLTSWTGGKY